MLNFKSRSNNYSHLLKFYHQQGAHLQILNLQRRHLQAKTILQQYFFLIKFFGPVVGGIVRGPCFTVHVKQINRLTNVDLYNHGHGVLVAEARYRPHCILQRNLQLFGHTRESHDIHLTAGLHQAHVIGNFVVLEAHAAPDGPIPILCRKICLFLHHLLFP